MHRNKLLLIVFERTRITESKWMNDQLTEDRYQKGKVPQNNTSYMLLVM